MRLSGSRWIRVVVTWLIICLLASAGLTDPMPQVFQPLLDKLADATVISGTTTVDADLGSIGFDKAKQDKIHGWNGLSPARKIEAAYWAAEKAHPRSGEDFLALLSRQLSNNHRTLQTDGDVRPFLERSAGSIDYGDLRRAPRAKPSDPGITGAITAMSRELEGNHRIFTENLLRAGGMSQEQIYDVLRESGPSRREALFRAVEARGSHAEQTKMLQGMAQHFVDNHGPRPVPPEIQQFADAHRPHHPPPPPIVRDQRGGHHPGGHQATRHSPGGDPDGPNGSRPRGPRGGGSGGDGSGLRLGNTHLPQYAAKPLERQGFSAGSGRMGAAIRNVRFVGRNGGVSFGEIAVPKPGTRVPPLSLRYDRNKPDGKRAVITAAGAEYTINAPDWILLPVTEWSSDKDVGLVTGFGHLQNAQERQNCGLVFNYAPAVDGTLIGLRLMQADVVLWPGYGDLFKLDDQYVLGTGETAPTATELAQRSRRQASVEAILPEHESYVLTDADLKITFELKQGQIVFTGEPVYRLWKRTPSDPAASDDIDTLSSAALVRRVDQAEKTLRARFDVGLTDAHDIKMREGIRALAAMGRSQKPMAERRAALRILERVVANTAITIIPDDQNPLSNPRTIEELNPTVYRSVTQFAQLAAWFRYVQANHPTAWAAFRKGVPPAAAAKPRVPMPTCGPRP